jgi:hypothetical protein
MAFKLGRSKGMNPQRGEVKNKFRFAKDDLNIPGTPVYRKELDGGILGEANDDGSIFISTGIPSGSTQEEETVCHEMKHITDMKVGKLAYGDDYIKWEGQTFPRKEGKIKYYGKWIPEGSKEFPWEKH